MARYLAGVASALLLVAAGFLIWTSRAEREPLVPAPKTGAAFAAGSAEAPGEPPSAPEAIREQRRFARYDGDENGTITRAEMLETRRKAFQRLDVDHDGHLSFEEWTVTTAERFDKADANHDGILNAAEFATTKRDTKPKKCDC
ncbi:MAG TPA: EF-hand domain-containing protein [Allosphingosinicella sp.]|nr:EF-hand domain-containing protein [Allosphingosinicella sp.]